MLRELTILTTSFEFMDSSDPFTFGKIILHHSVHVGYVYTSELEWNFVTVLHSYMFVCP